jgi:hypothetical protein
MEAIPDRTTGKENALSLSVTFCHAPADLGRPTRRPGLCRHGLITFYWLIGPVGRIGEHVGPEVGHLAVVAIVASVREKDTAGIVLG